MDSCNFKDLCYKTSNNKHFNCPPRMDDARHFTDYRGNCNVNNLIRNNNNIFNSFQYRAFLTNNANKLMELNRSYACQKNCCGPCQKPYEIGTTLPLETNISCGSENCGSVNTLSIDKENRKHSNRKLHCNQWPSDLPYNMPKNCCTPPKNNFDYYPDTDQNSNIPIYRNSGGINRSTSNSNERDVYRFSGGINNTNTNNNNRSYLPGGDPSFYM